jgi:hypothetical protein
VLDVEDGADVATGMSNLTFEGSAPDGTAIVVGATYYDELSRRSDRLRISRRAIEIHHFAPLPGVTFTPDAGPMSGLRLIAYCRRLSCRPVYSG